MWFPEDLKKKNQKKLFPPDFYNHAYDIIIAATGGQCSML